MGGHEGLVGASHVNLISVSRRGTSSLSNPLTRYASLGGTAHTYVLCCTDQWVLVQPLVAQGLAGPHAQSDSGFAVERRVLDCQISSAWTWKEWRHVGPRADVVHGGVHTKSPTLHAGRTVARCLQTRTSTPGAGVLIGMPRALLPRIERPTGLSPLALCLLNSLRTNRSPLFRGSEPPEQENVCSLTMRERGPSQLQIDTHHTTTRGTSVSVPLVWVSPHCPFGEPQCTRLAFFPTACHTQGNAYRLRKEGWGGGAPTPTGPTQRPRTAPPPHPQIGGMAERVMRRTQKTGRSTTFLLLPIARSC